MVLFGLLPEDMISVIVSYLPWKQIAVTRRLCHSWNRVILANHKEWILKEMCLRVGIDLNEPIATKWTEKEFTKKLSYFYAHAHELIHRDTTAVLLGGATMGKSCLADRFVGDTFGPTISKYTMIGFDSPVLGFQEWCVEVVDPSGTLAVCVIK